MEHVYKAHTRQLEGQTYYFVKKIMTIPELGEAANVVTGYGMHTDFEKACHIAGIEDEEVRKKLLAGLEQSHEPKEAAPAVKKPAIVISESVNKWLAEAGIAVLN
jgi:hypothetical protein